MRKNIKPENWGQTQNVGTLSATPNPNRDRIEAKIAEIKAKLNK